MQGLDLDAAVLLSNLTRNLILQPFLLILIDFVKTPIFVTGHQASYGIAFLGSALMNDTSVAARQFLSSEQSSLDGSQVTWSPPHILFVRTHCIIMQQKRSFT